MQHEEIVNASLPRYSTALYFLLLLLFRFLPIQNEAAVEETRWRAGRSLEERRVIRLAMLTDHYDLTSKY
jgi:hypothetical protein